MTTPFSQRFALPLALLAWMPPTATAQFVGTTFAQSIDPLEQGPTDGDWFGYSVASLGDLDGDGTLELAVGAPRDQDATPETGLVLGPGAVFILHLDAQGQVSGLANKITPDQIDPNVQEVDQFGVSVAALGDVNGDGVGDLAVGAPGHSDSTTPAGVTGPGAVYVLFLDSAGGVSGSARLSQTSLAPLGIQLLGGDGFGSSVTGMGDLDGDGVPDLAVGSMGHSSTLPGSETAEGGVYLFTLQGGAGATNPGAPSGWSLIDEADLLASNPADPNPLGEMYLFGSAVCPAGDLNGDGTTDLCVGVDYDGFEAAPGGGVGVLGFGALYVLLLDPSMNLVASQKVGSNNQGGFAELLEDHDVFGASLALMDTAAGEASVAVGAWGDEDANYGGAIWMLTIGFSAAPPGSGSLAVKQECKLSGSIGGFGGGTLTPMGWFGAGIASLGDVYPAPAGDGVIDLVVGEPHRTAIGPQSFQGGAWVLPRAAPTNWKDMGKSQYGVSGTPRLEGFGSLAPNSTVSIQLTNANPSATTYVLAGLTTLNLGFQGGLLVPSPDIILAAPTDAAGNLTLAGTWPGAVPPGVHMYFQAWITDPTPPSGFAASNAMSGTTP